MTAHQLLVTLFIACTVALLLTLAALAAAVHREYLGREARARREQHRQYLLWRASLPPLDDEPAWVLQWHPYTHPGCCTACRGTGTGYDPETNGRCWDCYGTGHAHEPELEPTRPRP